MLSYACCAGCFLAEGIYSLFLVFKFPLHCRNEVFHLFFFRRDEIAFIFYYLLDIFDVFLFRNFLLSFFRVFLLLRLFFFLLLSAHLLMRFFYLLLRILSGHHFTKGRIL